MSVHALVFSDFVRAGPALGLERSIHRKGPEWKILTVAMVAKIKDAGEPCPRVHAFRPGSVSVLMAKKIVDAAHDAEGLHLSGT